MDQRVKTLEKNIASIEDSIASIRLDNSRQLPELQQGLQELKHLLLTGTSPASSSNTHPPPSPSNPQNPDQSATINSHSPLTTTDLHPHSSSSNHNYIQKLQMPIFTGTDPFGWIARSEQYFELQNTPPAARPLNFNDESHSSRLEHFQQLELSLCSAYGLSQPKTMKIMGLLASHLVLVMVDSGASHNFVSSDLAQALNLAVEPTDPFLVKLGDGHRMKTSGVCSNLHLQLGSYTISGDFFIFPLRDLDIILGVAWLETLGDVQVNWQWLTMKFLHQNQLVELCGDPSLTRGAISAKSFSKVTNMSFSAVLLELSIDPPPMSCVSTVENFDVFLCSPTGTVHRSSSNEIYGLPPRRSTDHRIALQPGQGPISVKPYKYGHIQKDEIERLVHDMLSAGIIKPSSSPYSNPVLLVKKKDGSWRFCVDYRQLNHSTIPHKYPIPVIQELLDELHGSQVFSKLDHKSGFYQIRVAEADTPKTTFWTHSGHYEFLVMPFGLTNAPATFQALNQKKCFFGRKSVEYLGHIISKDGVVMDPSKVSSILQWPIPKSTRAVRGFLGITGYYRRFIANYGQLARPLTTLSRRKPKPNSHGHKMLKMHSSLSSMP
ncbi:uncharacterized protein LOC119371287 [Jatropha curcas]|uniref:uncharacterized protein LOC119371287 n=1 Tax=Jatropha curcas TaxID=180498 RepID=UPI0018952E8B|nr:uncharacterized protein LOC119371287 [Jatropha curcas]